MVELASASRTLTPKSPVSCSFALSYSEKKFLRNHLWPLPLGLNTVKNPLSASHHISLFTSHFIFTATTLYLLADGHVILGEQTVCFILPGKNPGALEIVFLHPHGLLCQLLVRRTLLVLSTEEMHQMAICFFVVVLTLAPLQTS